LVPFFVTNFSNLAGEDPARRFYLDDDAMNFVTHAMLSRGFSMSRRQH